MEIICVGAEEENGQVLQYLKRTLAIHSMGKSGDREREVVTVCVYGDWGLRIVMFLKRVKGADIVLFLVY